MSGHEERAALISAVCTELWRLGDMDELAKVALVAGLSVEEIRELGGLS